MYAPAVPRIAPAASVASAVAALFLDERAHDTQGVAIPRTEVHLVVRFGPSARGGLDVHALGGRERVHRKLLRRGQRAVAARLHLGAAEAVLGVPDSTIAGRIVPLEDLWGDAAERRLVERIAAARDMPEAAAVLERAISERLAPEARHRARNDLVLAAAGRLTRGDENVGIVALDLGVSERQLRRVFHQTIGVGPKTFAKVTRFRRAVRAAREEAHPSWARIAAAVGYYDQAHLIAEFRAIAGVTPQTLLGELRAAQRRETPEGPQLG
jgi:AraC-like DNA-binding protein